MSDEENNVPGGDCEMEGKVAQDLKGDRRSLHRSMCVCGISYLCQQF
jgi:hypothetical protein